MRLRVAFVKGEPVRYISHLDLTRTFERALRRARIPVALSEGFNPHMKIAYASALGVGVTGAAEYFDVELKEALSPDVFTKRLNAQLPSGLRVTAAVALKGKQPSLTSVIDTALYTVTFALPSGTDGTSVARSLAAILADQEVFLARETPKGRRGINLREYLLEGELKEVAGDLARITLWIKISPAGSIKPGEVVAVLADRYGLPVVPDTVQADRLGLFTTRDGRRLSPLELVK